MFIHICFVAVIQAGQAETLEDLIRKYLETDDVRVSGELRRTLESREQSAGGPVREVLKKLYLGRPDPTSPENLVKALDANAVLDLQEYGADSLDALETASRTAEGDRKALIERLIASIRLNEQRGYSRSARADRISHLVNILSRHVLPGDELVLLKILLTESPSIPRERMLTVLSNSALSKVRTTEASFMAVLAAADLRPATIGRPLWNSLYHAGLVREPDWKKMLKEGGPWSRAVAAFRLTDEAAIEKVIDNATPFVRPALLETLSLFLKDNPTNPTILRVLTKFADHPDNATRRAVASATRQLDSPDLLINLILREPEGSYQDEMISRVQLCKNPPSNAALLQVLEKAGPQLLTKLSRFFLPGESPILTARLAAAYEKAGPREKRGIALLLARYDHDYGVRQIEFDLKSSISSDVESALEEVSRYRLSRFAAQVWALLQHPNSQIAVMARPAAILLGAADHPKEVRKMVAADPAVRNRVGRILAESNGPGDLPLITALALSADYQTQTLVLDLLEGMKLTKMNDALAALRQSPHEALRPRINALLGKFEFPSRLPEILADLTVLDARKRHEAQEKFDRTDLTGIRFRVVEGPGAMKENVVEVPVEVVRSLVADSPRVVEGIVKNLVPGPVPASLADPGILIRGNVNVLVSLLVQRGDKEDVRQLYLQGLKTAEVSALGNQARSARAIHPEAVDAFLNGWLRNPPLGARRDVIALTLSEAVVLLPAAETRQILIALFRDDRPDVHQAPLETIRKHPSLAFPAEAVADFRQGKIKDKSRLFLILGAVRSPEGEELLREWLKDPTRQVRIQSAAALAKLLKADAIPMLGEALGEWHRINRWTILHELTQGIGPKHQEALQSMRSKATEEEKPMLDILLFLSGVDATRERVIALFPEQGPDRHHYLLALSNRSGPVDDALVESLLRIDQPLHAASAYLKILVKSNTVKAAELAKFIMETAYRQQLLIDEQFGAASELLVRRLPDPPLELISHFGLAALSGPGVVRALATAGSEQSIGLLIRLSTQAMGEDLRELMAQSLRKAKRFPALQKEVIGKLEGQAGLGEVGAYMALLAHVEREAGAQESLLKFMAKRNLHPAVRLAALQTALTIPGTEAMLDPATLTIPNDFQGSDVWLPEIVRVIVKGGSPRPQEISGFSFYPLLLAAWARNRAEVAKHVSSLPPNMHPNIRGLLEATANRALPTAQEVANWAKSPGTTPSVELMTAELKALGVDNLHKALRDQRPFVRANAAWILQKLQGRKQFSRGPWVAVDRNSRGGALWLFPEPPAEEIEALEKN